MKNALIVIGVLLYSFSSFSQEYIPLLEDNKTWNVLSVLYIPGAPYYDTAYSTINYQVMGDTTLNSINYKKVYKSNEEYPINWFLESFMREDEEHKVWMRMYTEEEEYLMYDFDAQIGAVFSVGYGAPVSLTVDSITLVEVDGGIRKKQWLTCLEMPSYKETWINGIGSNKGLLWSGSAMVVGGWYWLLCVSEDGSVVFENPDFDSCYLVTGQDFLSNTSLFYIYPNPAQDYISINIPSSLDSKSIEIDIYSMSGKIVDHFEINTKASNSPYIHSVNNLESGIYFCQLKAENSSSTVKLVISH